LVLQPQDVSDKLLHAIPRNVSEMILRSTPAGCYLVRQRNSDANANEQAYAISVRMKDGTICHVQLNHRVLLGDFTVTKEMKEIPNCTTLHQAIHALASGGASQSLVGQTNGCMRMVIYSNRQAGRLPPPPEV
jgi:hypothetical protein